MSEARRIDLDSGRMTVTATYEMTGSILAGTAAHHLHAIETLVEITSGAAHEEIAALVATAEQMCFVLDAIERPHTVQRSVLLNGTPL